ncbi:YbjN domain-containing protein [bacterium]|nr:YbjN domain-containing protein [bacterium]
MPRWVAFLALCLLVPAATRGQDAPAKAFTPADFEKLLKAELKRDFEVNTTPSGKTYDIIDTPYYALFNEKSRHVTFYVTYGKQRFAQEPTLEKINEWNRKAVHSRVFLASAGFGGGVKYEAAFSVAAGVMPGQVKNFYDLFDREHAEFLKLMGGLKPPPPEVTGPPETVRQGFPAAKYDPDDPSKTDTAWEVQWDIPNLTRRGGQADSRVLRIVSAKFHWKDEKKRPRSLVVARNLMLAEAFSQYDNQETCFLDVAKVGTPMLKANKDFLGPLCVGPGKILASTNADHDGKVYQELHYDGLRWMGVYDTVRARGGEKLVLWAAMKSGNYAFLMEYNFTDDGRIVSRLGFTAHNLFDRAVLPKEKGLPHRAAKTKDGDVHAHFGCWRMEFDLSDPDRKVGGPAENTIQLVSRKFTDGKFGLKAAPFPGVDSTGKPVDVACEGKAKWAATEFTTLRAESTTVKNTRGQPVAYDLISSRTGAASDFLPIGNTKRANMDFVNYDYWVTRTPESFKHYHQVPEVAAGCRPLAGERATVWHSVGGIHSPRDEDFGPGGVDAARGAALTEWVGFTLKPRNLFDGTPLYAR